MKTISYKELPHKIIRTITGDSFDLPPPLIINEELIPKDAKEKMSAGWETGTFQHRDILFIELQNVFSIGEGLVLTPDANVINESVTQHTPEEIKKLREEFLSKKAYAEEILDLSLLARKRGDDNYGHWLVECLSKISLFSEMDISCTIIAPNADSLMKKIISDSIELVSSKKHKVFYSSLDTPVFHKRLILVEGLSQHGIYLSPIALQHFDLMQSNKQKKEFKRIYITRKDLNRDVANEEELTKELIEKFNFQSINPQLLSLNDQIAIFREAEIIIGPIGAGMTNIVFASKNAQIITLAPAPMPDTFFYFLANHRKQKYTEIRCPILNDDLHWQKCSLVAPLEKTLEMINQAIEMLSSNSPMV